MQIDDAQIDKLARLAMLQFDAEEKEAIKADLQKMIGFVSKLQELDTTGVAPLLHMGNKSNVFREDKVANMLTREEALQNAPLHNGQFFVVPKVIKKHEQ